MNDPNLYGKFKPYWGCMHCAANWEQPGTVVVTGTMDASASGSCGEFGDFVVSDLDTLGSELQIHECEGHFCVQCEEYWDGPEHYGSQAQVNEHITATPEVERAA